MGENDKRITYKRTRANPFFQKRLKALLEESRAKKSKLEPMIKESLNSLSKYPLPLKTGAECEILLGFNKKLCIYLDNCLEALKTNQDSVNCDEIVNVDQEPSTSQKLSSVSLNNHDSSVPSCSKENLTSNKGLNNNTSPENQKFKYEPAFRSGSYAILLGLLELANSSNPSVKKDQLIEVAQKYSEESFVRPKPGTFYTAWSNITTLMNKDFVKKIGRKEACYSLTEQGMLLAGRLNKEMKSKTTTNDFIFTDSAFSNECNPIADNNVSLCRTNIDDLQNHSQTADEVQIKMNAGTFDIILLIDKNETSGLSKKNDPTVAQFKKYPDLLHEYRSLKVGDFTWIARNKVNKDQEVVLPYIVERKRMDDLGASIKDGRFHEQKFRLRKCGLDNVIYMIENYGGNKQVGLPIQTLLQAMSNTRVQDGFKVHRTDSLTNSTRFLAMMTKRLTIQYKDKNIRGSNQEPKNDCLMTFEYFNESSSKSKPLSVTDTFIKLLLQLKGVSVEKALAVTKTYKTPASLIEKYKECGGAEGEKLLESLRYDEISNVVGPSVSRAIYQLFKA